MSKQSLGTVRVDLLAQLVRNKRKSLRLTLQRLSEITGVSAATLSRIERFEENSPAQTIHPDMSTVTALVQWLGIPLEQVVIVSDSTEEDIRDLPKFVEAHLRANRNIKPEDADLISRVFRDMYEKYAAPE